MVVKHLIRNLTAFCFVIFISLSAYSKNPNRHLRFININTEHGLPHNRIYDFTQDKLGFVWAATEEGVVRIHKKGVWILTDDHSYVPTGRTKRIATLENGDIVFDIMNRGFYKYDYSLDTVTKYFHLQKEFLNLKIDHVSEISIAENHIFLATPKGLFSYDLNSQEKGNRLKLVLDTPSLFIENLPDGGWVIGHYDLYYKKGNNTPVHITPLIKKLGNKDFRIGPIVASTYDQNSNKIYLTGKKGTFELDLDTYEMKIISQNQPTVLCFDTALDLNGKLYTCSNDGLEIYDIKNEDFTIIKKNPERGLVTDVFHKAFVDTMGNIWISTWNFGIMFLDNQSNKFQTILSGNDDKCFQSEFVEGIEFLNKKLYINASKGELYEYDIKKDILEMLPLDGHLINGNIFLIKKIDESKLLLSGRRITTIYDVKKRKVLKEFFFTGRFLLNAFKENDETTWLLSWGKMGKLNNNTLEVTYPKLDFEFNLPLNCMARLSKDELLIGTDKGLLKFRSATGEVSKILPSDSLLSKVMINYLSVHNETIYACTKNNGLLRINAKNGQYSKVHKCANTPFNTTDNIQIDSNGNLWVSGENGIFRYAPETEETLTFSKDDGLMSNIFQSRSGMTDADGNIYFGGWKGITFFHPDSILETKIEHPKTFITEFTSYNTSTEQYEQIDDGPIINTDVINLPTTNRRFNISFASANYNYSNKIMYRYKLEGFDYDWHRTNDFEITYKNVRPGKYTFHVTTQNADGSWSDSIKKIKIQIAKPWWASTWSISGFILLGIFAIRLLIFWRTKSLEKSKRTLQRIVEKRTKEINHKKEELEVQYRTIQMQAEELQTYNDSLEEMVNARTNDLKLKNQILEDHAFFNSHMLRKPVSNILGLIQLFDLRPDDISKREIFDTLKVSARNLDGYIRKIQEMLRNERKN